MIPETDGETAGDWVLYDGECRLCTGSARRFASRLQRHGFELAPLQTPAMRRRAGLKPGESLVEMKLLVKDGSVFGGADAVLQIARRIWWAWPLYAISFLPGVKRLFRAAYRRAAVNRGRWVCSTTSSHCPRTPPRWARELFG